MKSKTGYILILSCLLAFTGCATIGSVCRDVSRADRIFFSFKEVVGSTVVFEDSPFVHGPFGSSQKGLPPGFRLSPSSIVVHAGSTAFILDHVEKCGNEIKYNARLLYGGQFFPNLQGSLKINRWSSIFRDPSKKLQLLLKASRSKT